MLVKIIALGLEAQVWKDLFARLQEDKVSTAVATYCEPLEMAGLLNRLEGYHQEACDILLCGVMAESNPRDSLKMMADIHRLLKPAPSLVLALPTPQLQKLVASRLSLRVELPKRSPLPIFSPALLVEKSQLQFPLLEINSSIKRLIFRNGDVFTRHTQPHQLPDNTLIGLDMLENIHDAHDNPCSPSRWLKTVLKEIGVQLNYKPLGILKNSQGLFLSPGVSTLDIGRIWLNNMLFESWLDLDPQSKQGGFKQLLELLARTAQENSDRWRTAYQAFRQAEQKTDVPIWLQGGTPLLRDGLRYLLLQAGYKSVQSRTSAVPFNEPALLLHLDEKDPLEEIHLVPPNIVHWGKELSRLLTPLSVIPNWQTLEFRPSPAANPDQLAPEEDNLQIFQGRHRKLLDALKMNRKRLLMLQQTKELTSAALSQPLLNDNFTNWQNRAENHDGTNESTNQEPDERNSSAGSTNGSADSTNGSGSADGSEETVNSERQLVPKALLFTDDDEEAADWMLSCTHIPQKRWLNLQSVQDAETLLRFPMPAPTPPAPHSNVADANVTDANVADSNTDANAPLIFISVRTKARLLKLKQHLIEEQQQAQDALVSIRERDDFYRTECQKQAYQAHQTASDWLLVALERWLQQSSLPVVLEQTCKDRERVWFSASYIHNIGLIASSHENRQSILNACKKLLLSLKEQRSAIPQFIYHPEDYSLPSNEHPNLPVFNEYIQMLRSHLSAKNLHLLLIEYPYEIACSILEALAPEIKDIPAIVLMPDTCSPPPILRPKTRFRWVPRLGSISLDYEGGAVAAIRSCLDTR